MKTFFKSAKRAAGIVCMAAVLTFLLSSASVFAAPQDGGEKTSSPLSAELAKETKMQTGELKLTKSSFEEGSTNVPVDTVGIKLYFDGDVTDESVRSVNDAKGMFKFISGEKGEKEDIDTEVYFDKKNNDCILVTATKRDEKGNETSLEPKSNYSLTISGKLTSADGKTLGEDMVINFQTVDTSGSSKIYMLLMVLMVAGMIAMTVISNKRKEKAKAEAANTKVINPYKLAKEKGITVQEANLIVEKEKQKREKRLKAAGIDPASLPEPKDSGVKVTHVKMRKPVSAAGSTYKTGRKAAAEKKACAASAKSNQSRQSSKKRNTKGGRKRS